MKKSIMLLAALVAFLCASTGARAYEAYIDDQSGIVVARGEATRFQGEGYEVARKRAVDDARNNLLLLIERQYIDRDTTTVGQYLSRNPEKRAVVDRFIATAGVFKEEEDKSVVKVTLLLPFSGADGYQTMIAEMTGREIPAVPGDSGNDTSAVDAALKEKFAARSPEEIGEPYRIALITFDNQSDFTQIDLGGVFTDMLRNLFKTDRRFVLLTMEESMEALHKNNLTLSSIRTSDITSVTPMDGIDGLVTGALVKYEPRVNKHGIGGTGYLEMNFDMELELQVLDAKSGRWMFYEVIPVNMSERTFTLKSADDAEKFIAASDLRSNEGLAARAVLQMLKQVDTTIRSSFPLEGYVLKTISDWVYINLTRIDGIKEGDVLSVYRMGDVLVDPITGKTVDRIKDRIGTIEIVDVKESYSQARARDLFGLKIQPGDIVMLK